MALELKSDGTPYKTSRKQREYAAKYYYDGRGKRAQHRYKVKPATKERIKKRPWYIKRYSKLRIRQEILGNMGAITKKEVEAFATYVLGELYLDWKMKWTIAQPGICLKKSQQILIPKNIIGQYPWDAKEYILHETAHIFTDDNQHGEEFYKSYIALLRRFMIIPLQGE